MGYSPTQKDIWTQYAWKKPSMLLLMRISWIKNFWIPESTLQQAVPPWHPYSTQMHSRTSLTHLWTWAPWWNPVMATKKWFPNLVHWGLTSSRSFNQIAWPMARVGVSASVHSLQYQLKISPTRPSPLALKAIRSTYEWITGASRGSLASSEDYKDCSHLPSEWTMEVINHLLGGPDLPLSDKPTLPLVRLCSSSGAPLNISYFDQISIFRSTSLRVADPGLASNLRELNISWTLALYSSQRHQSSLILSFWSAATTMEASPPLLLGDRKTTFTALLFSNY